MLSFNHPSIVLTADVSRFLWNNKPLESAPRGSPIDPKFDGVTTATCSYVVRTRCESSSPRKRNEPLGYYFTILDRILELIGAYYRGETDLSFWSYICWKSLIVYIEIWVEVFIYTSSIWNVIWNVQQGKGRFYSKVLSGYSCIQSKLTVE